ncbi:AAA family ATPase [Paenibacillus thermotolerans]|uniref:AAA family ATPase n=1 Tax=Paenibacillus thermotolerans TaxID=3027807 RepID=UPI0023683C62|nr:MULTISPECIES: AAA family ATPase [unclassified Paenibacillus]
MTIERTTNHSLILSKLYRPQALEPTVPRPHLIDRLNKGLSRRAVLLTAPAGYGKSTLIGHWAAQLSVPVGWLSLDEKDNDLIRFWSYAVAAVEQAAGSISEPVRAAASTLSPGQYEPFLVALLNEASKLQGKIVLVLDDWHVIREDDIIASVSFFLEYLPPTVHLCFASRNAVTFPKARCLAGTGCTRSASSRCASICGKRSISLGIARRRKYRENWLSFI